MTGLSYVSYRLALATVGHKIVDWDFNFPALLQFGQHIDEQVNVKCIRMIKVIFVDERQLMLLLV